MIELPGIDPSLAQLYCLIARACRKAVVFRRGPSKRVCLLTWDLETDVLEQGQWFKGRVYERRCDLSPDGKLLAYFAASYRPPHYTWTAVSRPPWLTALEFFPKGLGWGGGGLFETDNWLKLNHMPGEMACAGLTLDMTAGSRIPDYRRAETKRPWEHQEDEREARQSERKSPSRLHIGDLGEYSGGGGDDPICWLRLKRDGWVWPREDGVERVVQKRGSRFEEIYDPPNFRRKAIGQTGRHVQVSTHAMAERSGRLYVQTLEIVEKDSVILSLGRVDWADLDHNGDLLFSAQGRLHRMNIEGVGHDEKFQDAVVVADLNDMRFEAVKPPTEALTWPR